MRRALLPLVALLALAAAPADYEFAYRWPQAAARIPALAAWLKADRARLRAETAHDAAADRAAARADGFDYRPHAADQRWQVVTETPRLLSLSGQLYTYGGGAHGNSATLALVWDKAAGRRIAPTDPFTSPAALEAAIRPAWCAALKAEQMRRRQGIAADGPFATCPPLDDLTLLLGSSDRRRIDRLGLVADAYVAGPYAEGAYEVTLPVTAAVLGVVRPAWREAFARGR